MMNTIVPAVIILVLLLATVIEASLHYIYPGTPHHSFFDPHPKVLEVESHENFLPEWQRSQVRKNPAFHMAHPLYSYPHHGEEIIYDRPTDKVLRSEIYWMLIHAGFIKPIPFYHSQFPIKKTTAKERKHNNQDADDPPFVLNQNILQYL